MMKKILLSLFFMALINGFISAQDLKLTKDKVVIDNKEVFKYEKQSFVEYSLFDLKNDEVLNLQFKDNGTAYESDDYMVFNFVGIGVKFSSTNFEKIAGLGSKSMMKNLIQWLLKEKVFSNDGNLDKDKLEIFINKYEM
ncbi:hypothetical protein SAMN05421857_2914 [Chryseobacterium formosense]|nr:hypothetical protein [Chryseobacterium formosense]SFT74131.1 hypothetical protein SAMN05421857_2914 [Chryseobacterium formosense]